MTRITVFLIALISITIQAQNEKEEVKLVIDTFFKGFHIGDTILMKSVMVDKVFMQTVYKNKEGKDVLVTDKPGKLTQAIANRPLDQKWDERLLNYNIQVDGNMANAWTPYEFWLNDEFHHCGVNSFQLFKDGEQWKIIYLIDTRRTSNCDPIDN